MNTSGALGVFGALPVDLLSAVCCHLPMTDVVTLGQLDTRMKSLVERIIYREIKALRVEMSDDESTIYFTNKDGRVKQLNLEHVDWEDVVRYGVCIERLELNICPGKSHNQLFQVLKKASFSLRSLNIRILEGSDKCPQKINKLHQRCIALVSQHRSSLRNLNAFTSGEQRISLTVNAAKSSMRFSYNQAAEPKPSEQMKHNTNHYFVYNMFHAFLEYHSISDVTLEVASTFDANLALQKAFQAAIPYSKRRALERLTIEFGSSLKAVTEEDMKAVLLRHVDEFHLTTPNLQHFHCSLPHDEIDLSQDFLAQLSEPVLKSRKDSTSLPYNSSISLRAVRCQ